MRAIAVPGQMQMMPQVARNEAEAILKLQPVNHENQSVLMSLAMFAKLEQAILGVGNEVERLEGALAEARTYLYMSDGQADALRVVEFTLKTGLGESDE